MASGILMQMARVKPPTDNANDQAVTTSASSGIDLGSTISPDCAFCFISTVAFNINFGTTAATVTDPSAIYFFAANVLYSFSPADKSQRFFKLRATAAGTVKWWRSTAA